MWFLKLLTFVLVMIWHGDALAKWSEWESLEGGLQAGPSAASWGPNRLDIFVRGTDNAMWHKWWDGSAWKGWESLGGELGTKPGCASWGPSRIDCFALGTDKRLYHKWWDGAWKGWDVMGGEQFTSAPSVTSWGPNRLDIFVRGQDNALWHLSFDDPRWGTWESLGGGLASDPGCTSWGMNRIDCFVRGTDNALHHRWWDGQWKGWEKLGDQPISSAPTVSAWAKDRLDVFAQGQDQQLRHFWWDGKSWQGWESLGGGLTAEPGCVAWGPNRIDCFVRGTDGAMHHKWWAGQGPETATEGIQGEYRIKLAGFRVNNETLDHALQVDGKRDEVFLKADVRILDGKGNRVIEGFDPATRTLTFGDINGHNGRKQAGSASNKGGLRTGDVYPHPPDGTISPSEDHDLPMTLWEGPLVKGENAVVVTPVIFEYDGTRVAEAHEGWVRWVKETSAKLHGSEEFKKLIGNQGETYLKLISLAQEIKLSLTDNGPLGRDGDRPIGAERKGNELIFQPKSIVLNYDAVETILKHQIGPKKGIYELNYVDSGGFGNGDYTIYLLIERK